MMTRLLIRGLLSRLYEPVFSKIGKHTESEYNVKCKELSKDEVLINEMNNIANWAKVRLQKRRKDDQHSAELHGMLAYHEMLRRALTHPSPIVKRTLDN